MLDLRSLLAFVCLKSARVCARLFRLFRSFCAPSRFKEGRKPFAAHRSQSHLHPTSVHCVLLPACRLNMEMWRALVREHTQGEYGILVDANTFAGCNALVKMEPQGAIKLKGKDKLVRTCVRAQSLKTERKEKEKKQNKCGLPRPLARSPDSRVAYLSVRVFFLDLFIRMFACAASGGIERGRLLSSPPTPVCLGPPHPCFCSYYRNLMHRLTFTPPWRRRTAGAASSRSLATASRLRPPPPHRPPRDR